MTDVGNSAWSPNRVTIMLVIIAIAVVAIWAINGGFDNIQVAQEETPVVSE